MSRERVEDLGRLLEKLDKILDKDIVQYDYFTNALGDYLIEDGDEKLSPEEVSILLKRIREIGRELGDISSTLYECLEICQGEDCLNCPEGV